MEWDQGDTPRVIWRTFWGEEDGGGERMSPLSLSESRGCSQRGRMLFPVPTPVLEKAAAFLRWGTFPGEHSLQK